LNRYDIETPYLNGQAYRKFEGELVKKKAEILTAL